MIYDPAKDKFLSPQPYQSWSLDSNDDWQAPITYPSVTDDGARSSCLEIYYFLERNKI